MITNTINNVVYKNIGKKHGISRDVVEQIMNSVSKVIATTIKENPDKVSVKLDFIGNFLSHPLRREIIAKKSEVTNREKVKKHYDRLANTR